MKQKIKNIFTKNIAAKIICVFAAIVLWIYVASGQSSVGKFPGDIQITAKNVPSGLVAIYDDKTVQVQIMAEQKVWKQLSADSFSAYVDLNGLSTGTYELSVNVASSVEGVQIISKTPDKIFVRLEKIVSKKVSVSPRTEGSAGEGLVAGNIELVPNNVDVSGPSSIVNNLAEAIAPIRLNGETADIEKNIPVTAYSDDGKEVKDLTFTPSEVKAKIPIVKASNNKTVGIKALTSGAPKDGFYVSKISIVPATVDVTGPISLLSSINYIETAKIDINNTSSNFEKEVALTIPDGVGLQKGQLSRVKVLIALSENSITRSISPQVVAVNLNSGLRLASYSPTEIKVMVSGPQSQINSLTSNDLKIKVNAAGRVAGNFNYDISLGSVELPAGLSAVSVLPSSIAVTLENK